jgi:iron complex outermembrane receptor protein
MKHVAQTCLLIGLLLAALPALAQTGQITGVATDPHGALIVGAQVQAVNLDTAAKTAASIGSAGAYSLPALQAGRYQIIVSAKEFAPYKSRVIVLAAGQSMVLDVQLAVGSAQTSVTVRAETETIANANPEVNVGPLAATSLLDIPYSVNVMTSQLLQNVQSSSYDDIYRINPTIQPWTAANRGWSPNFIIRGFSQANTSGKAIDGIPFQIAPTSSENLESIQVLSGLSGTLYGGANIAGMVVFTHKAPTQTRFENITMGAHENGTGFFLADLGGLLDRGGKLSYRFNQLGQGGDTPIQYQQTERYLTSGAVDWRPVRNFLFRLNYDHDFRNLDGTSAYWSFSSNATGAAVAFHPAPVGSSLLWAQKFTTFEFNESRYGSSLNWDASKFLSIRGGFIYDLPTVGSQIYSNNNVTDNSGKYSQQTVRMTPQHYLENGANAFADLSFRTKAVRHKLSGGYFENAQTQHLYSSYSASYTASGFNFVTPIYISFPAFATIGGAINDSSKLHNNSVVITDEATIGKHWAAVGGVTHASFLADSYNAATGVLTSSYNKGKWTPTASLTYKPVSMVSTYFTYVQGLEQGTIVLSTGSPIYTNKGQILPALTDHEYEAGAKTTIGKALLTGAWFDINRALQYGVQNTGTTTYTYVQDGREVHKGVEITASGNILPCLTVFGGLNFLSPKVQQNQNNPALNGKEPANVSEQMHKLYAEYHVWHMSNLIVTGGVYYTGKMWADTRNTDKLPAYTLGDLGLRYESKSKVPVTLRANVTNLTNKNYWMNGMYTGAPRATSFSTQFHF